MTASPIPHLFSWLHISDIHARHGDGDYRHAQAQVLRELATSASPAALPPGLERVDAILVTGDLAFSGGTRDAGEYDDVADLLGRLAANLSVPGDRVFVVPGNHDVDRSVATTEPPVGAWLERVRTGVASLGAADPALPTAHARRFARWRSFVAATAPHLTLDDHGSWHVDLTGHEGVPLRIVGLNTALLSQDDRDERLLRVGWAQGTRVLAGDLDRLTIVMGHHPLAWLGDPIDLLGPLRRRTDLYMHGHVHEQRNVVLMDGGGDAHATTIAGAVHLDPREHAAGRGRHAYMFGALTRGSGEELALRVWPRAYDPERGFLADARNCKPDRVYAELKLAKRLRRTDGPAPATVGPSVEVAPSVAPAPPVATRFRPPLVVYIAWHADSLEGADLAQHLYGVLHRSPDNPFGYDDLDIPVFFRSAPARGTQAPPPIDLDAADATAVVVILDRHAAGAEGAAFRGYARDLTEQCARRGGRRSVIPVATDQGALRIPGLKPTHYVRGDETVGADRLDRVVNGVAHHLTRLMRVADDALASAAPPPPIEVFVSHAKHDAATIAEDVRAHLLAETGVHAFVDRHELAPAWTFVTQIHDRLAQRHVVFLAVLSDIFASRQWCQDEVATARTVRRPIVILDARLRDRSNVAMLGNAPGLQWQPSDPSFWKALLRTIQIEALRYACVPPYLAAVETLWESTARGSLHVPRRPDAVDIQPDSARLLHPDPPLVPAEAKLLRRGAPALALVTPSTLPLLFRPPLPAGTSPELADDDLFDGKRIALSISESPDLAPLGFGAVTLVEAMVEFARNVLYQRGTIAYGGDLRAGGFTEQLQAIGRRAASERESADRDGIIQCYLAWPLHLDLVPARVDELAPLVEFQRLPEVTETPDAPVLSEPGGAALFAKNLTMMRRTMARETDARVLMGGPVTKSQGAMPGLVEEALVTLEAGKPLFLLGAFGGCGRLVWDALCGRPTPELDLDVQERARPGARAVVASYNAWAPGAGVAVVDYPALRERLAAYGPASLNNGLSAAENLRLVETPYIAEMIALVLLGCKRRFGG